MPPPCLTFSLLLRLTTDAVVGVGELFVFDEDVPTAVCAGVS